MLVYSAIGVLLAIAIAIEVLVYPEFLGASYASVLGTFAFVMFVACVLGVVGGLQTLGRKRYFVALGCACAQLFAAIFMLYVSAVGAVGPFVFIAFSGLAVSVIVIFNREFDDRKDVAAWRGDPLPGQ